MTAIKICGLTRAEDVRTAVTAGARYLGFVLAESPRQLTPAAAAELVAVARDQGFDGRTVGVFVGASPVRVVDELAAATLDIAQLHGDEPAADVAEVARHVACWRAVRVRPEWSHHDLDAVVTEETGVESHLVDTFVPDVAGGTGRTFRHEVAIGAAARGRLILAGGLTPETVADAIEVVRPYAVDVSSGVETEPGIKDPMAIAALVAAVRGASR